MKESELVKELNFEKNYDNFSEFMEECRESIYREFILGVEEMVHSGADKVSLVFHANVEDVAFKSSFKISADDTSLLTGIILDYFAEIGEYETCSKIVRVCKELNNKSAIRIKCM